jgi:hypothetical protein
VVAVVGLLIILALAVATGLLIRSMTRHLRRVPRTFETDSTEQGETPMSNPPQ